MKTRKQILINEILTGLLISTALASALPGIADAQNLAAAGFAAKNSILQPMVQIASYVAYSSGTIMTVAGIAGCKKHSDNPVSNPLAPALGRLGAGACFLAVPTVAGMLSGTAFDSGIVGQATYSGIGGF